jgi:hypothetical protein
MPRPSIVRCSRGERELTPRPAGKADAGRVLVDVRDDLVEIPLVLDHLALEPPLEEVADAVVAAVEADRVQAVQALHPGGELRLGRVNDEVEVVVEQAPDDEVPPVLEPDAA